MKTLVIVESPSKKSSIQKILGEDYEVLATYGHITDLPTNRMGIDVKNNFAMTYVIKRDKVNALQDIMNAMERCDNVILSSDPDLEGESIAFNLLKYLRPYKKPITRVVFNEITKSGIKKGLASPRDVDMNIVSASRSRRAIDRLTGFSCSPYLTDHYKSTLSAGRVQSAVVKLIVDLEKKIEAFKKEEYWHIFGTFTNQKKDTFTAKYVPKIQNKEEAEKAIEKILSENGYIVSSVKAEDRPKPANPPLITVKLQQLMAKEYGFEADRTMRAAQSLYETGFITYLRTDSVRISDEAIKPAREWLKNKGFSIPKKANKYDDGAGSQAGHECLRPTNLENEPESPALGGDDKIVYRAIYQHFLSSQMSPAIYSTLKISLTGINDKSVAFNVSGKALKEPGWLAIFGDQKTGKLELPLLNKDEPLLLDKKSIKKEQKFTQPPSRYTDASILEELESKGIGRPATYASIIQTITGRNYVEKQGNSFIPTKLGREITELLEQYFSFVDYNYTSKMEAKLDKVADGKMNALDMLNEFYSAFKLQLDAAYVNGGRDICSCGGYLLLRKSKIGSEFYGCNQFPSCRITKQIEVINNEKKSITTI